MGNNPINNKTLYQKELGITMINLNGMTSKVDCTNIENYEQWIASTESKQLEQAYINTYQDNKTKQANSYDVFAQLKSKYNYNYK